jgi:cysteine-rich repeat protein
MLISATLLGCTPSAPTEPADHTSPTRAIASLAAADDGDVCGDGVRTGSEQCDDGNTVNLDGCDSACRFEQEHRVNTLNMQFETDTDCATNQLGSAITAVAQGVIQSSLTSGITDGSITIMFKTLGLADLTGSDGPLQLGLLNGAPVTGDGYDGNNDLDWWYTTNPVSIDADRNPLQVLSGNLAAHRLDASGDTLTLNLVLVGQLAALTMKQVHLLAFTDAATAPTASASGTTPGHLASENLDPALVSFATTGTASANKMCGNITAESMARVPAPPVLVQGGLAPCTQGYTADNSLLDLIVGGCDLFIFSAVTAITPTQPDSIGGEPFTLALDSNHKVASCTSNGVEVDLATCLASATYSSYFQFTTDRVIAK